MTSTYVTSTANESSQLTTQVHFPGIDSSQLIIQVDSENMYSHEITTQEVINNIPDNS